MRNGRQLTVKFLTDDKEDWAWRDEKVRLGVRKSGQHRLAPAVVRRG